MNPTVITKVYAPKTIVKVSGLTGLKGDKGLDGNGGNFTLVSTQRIEIINNRILLPSKPEGDLIFNMMMIFETNDASSSTRTTNVGGVTVSTDQDGKSFADLNINEHIEGFGVVSYLTKISA